MAYPNAMHIPAIDPLTAAAVVLATGATDAVYVRFTSAVIRHSRIAAANWSSLWYLLSAFAVISYTHNGLYVLFAAAGSWIGAFLSAVQHRGEDWPEYGLSTRQLGKDLRLFLTMSAIVFPLFIAGYVAFTSLWPQLPPWVHALTPYSGAVPPFEFRLPDRFSEWVIDDVFVVALPEEFFYRGYLQTRLRDAWPEGRLFFGARLGKAFWVTAILFALGHLAIFQVYRLGVFFPALLFGWMRERTGTVIGAALLHACCNLLVLVLEASFYGAG